MAQVICIEVLGYARCTLVPTLDKYQESIISDDDSLNEYQPLVLTLLLAMLAVWMTVLLVWITLLLRLRLYKNQTNAKIQKLDLFTMKRCVACFI
mmetsp:Transcript_11648/g.16953  ORF Transcript_11648/g.16953 Transcript_11648/m.16953 type:complete len:95 (+) Transcript_11648:630-914(+)